MFSHIHIQNFPFTFKNSLLTLRWIRALQFCYQNIGFIPMEIWTIFSSILYVFSMLKHL